MTTQPIAASHPAPSRHQRIRTAAAIAGIAALIATSGFLATNSQDAAPPTRATDADVNPSAQTLRELYQSVTGQYGSHSAVGTAVNPSAQTLRDMHQSIANQYGNAFAAGAAVNPSAQVRRELHASIAGQYGPAR